MSKEVVTRMAHQVPMQGVAYSFEQVQRMAVSFANSKLFGVTNPDQALALMLYAQATGVSPPLIMRDYSIIHNTLAKKAEAILRDFQKTGGRVKWLKYADDGVTGEFTHPLYDGPPLVVTWDLARAKQAELRLEMFKKFPAAMFRSRCISEGVRTIAPDATEQTYTPEEIQGMHSEDAVTDDTVVSQSIAAEQGAEQAKGRLPKDRLSELLNSLEVKTLPELTAAFAAAWKEARGDDRAQATLKGAYDDAKTSIETSTIDSEEEA